MSKSVSKGKLMKREKKNFGDFLNVKRSRELKVFGQKKLFRHKVTARIFTDGEKETSSSKLKCYPAKMAGERWWKQI